MAIDVSGSDVFMPAEGIETTEVPDGYVVYEAGGSKVHYLSPSAVVIFELCDGKRDAEAIARLLAGFYELGKPPLDDVVTCLASLEEQKVLVRSKP